MSGWGSTRVTEEKFPEIKSLTRNFQSLNIDMGLMKGLTQSLFNVVLHVGKNVRCLKLSVEELENMPEFYLMLKEMPLLEKLDIVRYNIDKPVTLTDNKLSEICLKNLKVLELGQGMWFILKEITVPHIKTVVFDSYHLNHPGLIDPYALTLTNFLNRSDTLKEITIAGTPLKAIFLSDLPRNFKFHLKKLSFELYDEKVCENFEKFLESQAMSLEEIDLNSNLDRIIIAVFNTTRVKKLTLYSDRMPREKDFYDQLIPSQSIKDLIIKQSLTDEMLKGVLEKIPNLKNFKHICGFPSSDEMSKMLAFMAAHNPKLESLDMFGFGDDQDYINTKFDNLKSLCLKDPNSPQTLIKFIINNPSITSVNIAKMPKDYFEEFMTSLRNRPGFTINGTETRSYSIKRTC